MIIAYDITKKDSFSNVSRWLEDVKKYAGPNIVQILIGGFITHLTFSVVALGT